ncbi:unnamed protein product [Cochlearia groenlandica]
MSEGNSKKQPPPSLVRLCVWKAIDNVEHIGYVGGVEFGLLEQIVEHCTSKQLMHIEDSTQDTDLGPVTSKLWKRFYEKGFNRDKKDDFVEEFKRYKENNQWRKLYEAKMSIPKKRMEEYADKLKKSLYERGGIKIYSKATTRRKPSWATKAKLYNTLSISPPGVSANTPSTSRSNPSG